VYINSLSQSEFVDFLSKKKNLSPAVLSPSGKIHITDVHHFSRSVLESKFPDNLKDIYVEITEDYSNLGSKAEFWCKMISKNTVWLYDEKGNQPINPMFIPPIGDLVNDPYRTLAWQARRGGGYGKADGVNYQEFMWANFFREHIPFNSSKNAAEPVSWTWCQASPYSYYECDQNENQELVRILPFALILARSDAAKYLPGWGTGTIDPIDCSKGIEYNWDREHKFC